MNNLFLALLLISLGGLVVGLVKPSIVKQITRKQVLGKLGGAFIVFFILFGVTSSDAPKTTVTDQVEADVTNSPIKTASPTPEVLKVDLAGFVGEFDQNQLAAEEKYKDKIIQFTGKIKNISEDILGSYFMIIHPRNADTYYFGTAIQCYFKDRSALTSLVNGQTVTLQGKVNDQSLGSVTVKNCQVVQ